MSATSKRVLANCGGRDALVVKLAREVEALETDKEAMLRTASRLYENVVKERDAALARVAQLSHALNVIATEECRQQYCGHFTDDGCPVAIAKCALKGGGDNG